MTSPIFFERTLPPGALLPGVGTFFEKRSGRVRLVPLRSRYGQEKSYRSQRHSLKNVQSSGPQSGQVTLGRPFKAGTLTRIFHLVASRRLTQPRTVLNSMLVKESQIILLKGFSPLVLADSHMVTTT